MTKFEVAEKVSKHSNILTYSIILHVLTELEIMGLIKFETEREAVIKEAENVIGRASSSDLMIKTIKRLLVLVK